MHHRPSLAGATLGAAAGFGLVWLLVAVDAARHGPADVDDVSPPHVLPVAVVLGVLLVLASLTALVTGARAAGWTTAVVLVPASLGWWWEDASRLWTPVGLVTAALLAVAARPGTPRPSSRRRRLLVRVSSGLLTVAAGLVAGGSALDVLDGRAPLMVHHAEDASLLGLVLVPCVLAGAAAGLLLASLRPSAARPVEVRAPSAGLR